jgi:(1->4)-alpha-D-glucan 1-alpha-D-glucosylmutase
MTGERVVPRATYRLQLRPGFGFDEAAAQASYLRALGVSHAYLSPILQAAPGSTHGYDVIDHGRVNEELGGPAAHARMCAAFGAAGLGQVVDIVPNHMSVATHLNRWWWDVLENGPVSRYAGYFDVDWSGGEERMRDKVLLPVLGERYGRLLDSGAVRVHRAGGEFTVRVYDKVMPVALHSLAEPLARAATRGGSDALAFLVDAIGALPLKHLTDGESMLRRHRDKAVIAAMLGRLFDEEPDVARAVDDVLAEVNAAPEELDLLLEQQNYRLAFWRAARHDLDYRRFFDINTLAGLRMSDERVFKDTHALVISWVQEGVIDGLRVDHPDGLYDPEGYFRRLRQAAPRAWIVAEKILEHDEPLPETWPIDGTTGYEFANRVTGLFVDPEGEPPFTETWIAFVGEDAPKDLTRLVRRKKRLVIRELFASDLGRLVNVLVQVCERHRRYRDYSRPEMREALEELLACLPVYRTYVRAGEPATERDVATVNRAVEAAREERPSLDPDLLSFIRNILCGWIQGDLEQKLVLRLQQLSGAVMAKGYEDTALYCHQRFVALNEVGGDPERFGEAPADFHAWCQRIQARWPATLLGTSTHDTKRSEDVRARLAVLSEVPERWDAVVRRWSELAERHRHGRWPDKGMEYLLWQTLVGAWPIDAERLAAYAEKAAREAKLYTSWTSPDAEYEAGLRAFAQGVATDPELMAEVEAFVAPLRLAAWCTSLSVTAIKLTAPGVPDLYQGNEVWDLSLTDPDNRRPIDFERLERLAREVAASSVDEVMARLEEGAPKLWLIQRALDLRRRRPGWFNGGGGYAPLDATGARASRVVAFSRAGSVITVAPRLLVSIARDGWGDTALPLPPGPWTNVLTGERLAGGTPARLDALLARFPVAILAREEAA